MKKTVVLLILFVAIPAFAATVTYNRVTTYTDSSPIPASKIPLINYKSWYSPTLAGPWQSGPVVQDNVPITGVPDPPPGSTWFYSVSAILDGQESAMAPPASKTVPVQVPSAPPGCAVK